MKLKSCRGKWGEVSALGQRVKGQGRGEALQQGGVQGASTMRRRKEMDGSKGEKEEIERPREQKGV